MPHPIKFQKTNNPISNNSNFTKQISPRASIIENKIYLYFAADNINTSIRGLTNIYLSVSNDGIEWDLIDKPILKCFEKDATQRVICPDILKVNKQYIMFFSGVAKSRSTQRLLDNTNPNVGSLFYASSYDGVKWHIEREPILRNKVGYYGFGSPNLINASNNKLRVFYHRRSNSSFNIWSAELFIDDLSHIIEEKPIIMQTYEFDKESAYSPYVIIDKDGWHMYYAGWGGSPVQGRILYARSSDGLKWKKSMKPVLEPDNEYDVKHCSEPSLLFFNDQWHLFYEGCDSNGVWRILSAIEE